MIPQISCFSGSKAISPYYAALFRMALGLYLLILAIGLEQGSGIPLGLAVFLMIFSLLLIFGLGWKRKFYALGLWLGFAWLYLTHPLLEPVAAGLTGVLLLFQVLLPNGEGLQFWRVKADRDWRFPSALFWSGWVLLAVYFAWNAVLKLQSPSWTAGTALHEILQSILVQEGALRKALQGFSEGGLKAITWVLLGAELIFPIFCGVRRARPWVWLLMLAVQIFWLFLLDDWTGSMGLILFLLWIFDPEWLPARKPAEGKSLVLYDGVCGMCDGTVQFLLAEDHTQTLVFAALQGTTSEKVLGKAAGDELTSIVYVRDWQSDQAQKFTHSDAVLQILKDVGGFWRVVSWLRFVPRVFRDIVYQVVAKVRYRVFGKYNACPLPEPGLKERFLE